MKTTHTLAILALLTSFTSKAQFQDIYYYLPTNEPWPIPLFHDPITNGDFNGDGIDDVLCERFSISFSQAIGEFQVTEFSNPADLGARGITSADFTGDGYADIVTNTLYTSYLQSVLQENDGNGDIDSITDIVPTVDGETVGQGQTNQLTHADMDGDGVPDIVRTSGFGFDGEYYSNSVQVLRNDNYSGVWEFYLATTYQVYQRDVTNMVLGDLSGNGRKDVLYNWRINDFGSPVELRWVENNSTPGNMAFEETATIRSSFRPYVVGDVDGDGVNDILGYEQVEGELSWLPNLGDGNFGEPIAIDPLNNGVPTDIGQPRHILTDDLDDDGDTDLIVAVLSQSPESPVYVLMNNGSGVYSIFQTITGAGTARDLILADVTGNGKKELVRANFGGIRISAWPSSCTPVAPVFPDEEYVEGGMLLMWVPFNESVRCLIQGGTSIDGPYQYKTVIGDEPDEAFIPSSFFNAGTTYGWRVRCFCAGDPEDVPGPWSEISTFSYNPATEIFNPHVFPNPTMGEVRIAANAPGYTLRIYDFMGRMLMERYSQEQGLLIEAGALKAGMYILSFEHDGKFTSKYLSVQE